MCFVSFKLLLPYFILRRHSTFTEASYLELYHKLTCYRYYLLRVIVMFHIMTFGVLPELLQYGTQMDWLCHRWYLYSISETEWVLHGSLISMTAPVASENHSTATWSLLIGSNSAMVSTALLSLLKHHIVIQISRQHIKHWALNVQQATTVPHCYSGNFQMQIANIDTHLPPHRSSVLRLLSSYQLVMTTLGVAGQ